MLPTVWLLGTSGVGKTTVGWRLLLSLGERSVRAAFVDADQLRLADGIPAAQPELTAGGLAALEHGYRDAGAQLLIVAGPADDPAHLARLLPGRNLDHVLTVHLHASDDAIVERIHRRGWLVELAQDAVDYARSLDHGWADITLDTTSLGPCEVAGRLVAPAMRLLVQSRAATPAVSRPARDADMPAAVVVTGPGGSGVSTVGFQLFRKLARHGLKVGYVDSHQVGFVGPRPRAAELAGLRATNAVSVAAAMTERGVHTVVLTADPPTARRLQGALAHADMYWLDASPESLAGRLTARSAAAARPSPGTTDSVSATASWRPRSPRRPPRRGILPSGPGTPT
ncbi:AAA family ATPase [Prauserella oleivorans]